MDNFFGKYAYDIWTVGEKRHVDAGVAFDCLRVDIANGRPQNCGDALPGFDWHAAQAAWDKLDAGAKSAAVNGWVNYAKTHYDELCRAYPEGRAAMDKVIAEG
jgi:hypothetical protein